MVEPMKLVKVTYLFLVMVLVGCSSTSEEVATEFMGYIKNGQHLEMQESLSADSYQMMSMFYGSISNKVLKPYYRTGSIVAFNISKMAETSKFSRFKIMVTTKEGQRFTDTLDLVDQDGEWKVSKF